MHVFYDKIGCIGLYQTVMRLVVGLILEMYVYWHTLYSLKTLNAFEIL